MSGFDERNRQTELPHHIIIEGRSRVTISGVEDVESFDETGVSLQTSKGSLIVSGGDLRVDRLSIDKGELNIEGRIDSLQYADEARSGGFWSRLFR